MTKTDRRMVEKNLDLLFEFEKYVLTHPDTVARIPDDAVVVMQVNGDRQFNQWSRRMGERHAREGHPLVYIKVKKMGPVRSRIKQLKLGPLVAHAS